jgi:drug/metabolite transporter (DMT)-like permease
MGSVYLGLAFAVVVWGASFVAARLVLAGDGVTLTPVALATTRFLLASAVMAPVAVWRLRREGWPKPIDLLWLFLLGQLGISTYFWLQYTGVQHTSAGISAVLVVGLMPAAAAAVSHFTLGERIGWRQAVGLALGALGVLVVSSQRDLRVSMDSGFLLGVACLVANAFAFALYSSVVRRLRSRHSSLAMTTLIMVSGALGLAPIAALDGGWVNLGQLSPVQWSAIGFLVLACSVMAYFAYNYALAHLPAYRAVTWIYFEPVVAVALGMLLLQEQITVSFVAGGTLIAGSVYLVQRKPGQKPVTEPVTEPLERPREEGV